MKICTVSKLLVVGTSSSIKKYNKDYLEEKRNKGYKVISYSGNSLVYLYDIGFKPDFFVFFDPYAYVMGIENMGDDKSNWLKDTTYLGYDFCCFENLLQTNEHLNGSKSFGFTDFLSNSRSVDLYKRNPPQDVFKDCVFDTPITVNYDNIKNLNLSNNLYMIRNYSNELDKLTYYLIPLIFYFFKNLERIKFLGFGTFSENRYRGGKGSYSEYIKAYDKIIPQLNETKINTKVCISLEDGSYFKRVEEIFK